MFRSAAVERVKPKFIHIASYSTEQAACQRTDQQESLMFGHLLHDRSKNIDNPQKVTVGQEDHQHPLPMSKLQWVHFYNPVHSLGMLAGTAGLYSSALLSVTNTDQRGPIIQDGWVSLTTALYDIRFVNHNYSISDFLSIKLVKGKKKKPLSCPVSILHSQLSNYNMQLSTS